MGTISPRLRLAVAASVAIAALTLHPGAAAVASTAKPSTTATPESSATPSASAVAPALTTAVDTTGPSLIGGTVDKTTLSPSTGNASFTVTVKASDPSGVKTPTISADSTTTDQSEGFGSMDLVAGTATNGTWKRTITLPATAAPGTWEITLFPLNDTLGNSSGSFRTIGTLTVTTKTPTVSPGSVTISGTARVGSSLSATTANWPVGTTFTYVWLADGAAIGGATKKSFTPSAAELGKKLSVKVTGSLPGYKSASKTASATAAVAPGMLVTAIPTIVGTAKVGRSLSVSAGSWSQGTTFSYQWFAGSSPIKGATKSTFVPTAAQLGQRLSVKITGNLDGYTTTAKTSAQTSPVVK